MSENRRMPFYQDVDGYRIAGAFSADVHRKSLEYKAKPGDLFVSTFPKSGTTWTQQIVSLIFKKGEPLANFTEFQRRSPYLELTGIEAVESMLKPGSIKQHLPYYLTPMSPKAKYIWVVRNPKDTLVSFYYHTRTLLYLFDDGEFDDFFEIFMNGGNDCEDYFDYVLSWYDHRNDPNVMLLHYEELKLDAKSCVKRIGKFMGEQYGDMLEDDDETVLNAVLKYSSFEYMKGFVNDSLDFLVNNADKGGDLMEKLPAGLKHVIKFMSDNKQEGKSNDFQLLRKGIVGDWRNHFSEGQSQRMDAKIEAKLKDTELYTFWKSINCI